MTDTTRHALRRAAGFTLLILALPIATFAASRIVKRRLDSGDAESDEMRRVALMGGVDMEVTSKALRHARFDVGMGGVAVDLTRAELARDGATLEVFGAMGGVDVKVPATWLVTAESDGRSTALNVAVTPEDELADDAPRLRVISHARMSGVNVEAV
jgi:hypothetical protein